MDANKHTNGGAVDQLALAIEAEAEAVELGLKPAETGPSLLRPTDKQQDEAFTAILSTMPETYQRLVIADLESFLDSDDRVEFKPLTARVVELAWLYVYRCPRPLALPPEFCHAYAELEPGQWLKTWFDDCQDCLLNHPVLFWREGRQEKFRRIFDMCVTCGGTLGSERTSPVSRPCHMSVGSEYRKAMLAGAARF